MSQLERNAIFPSQCH